MSELLGLELLTDDDLAVLEAWVTPLAQVGQHHGAAVWGEQCWKAVVDEIRRRDDGYDRPTPWPGLGWLSLEDLAFLGPVISTLHDAGSGVLREWVEVLSDWLVREYTGRMELARQATTAGDDERAVRFLNGDASAYTEAALLDRCPQLAAAVNALRRHREAS